ncbi:MAG TPA: hypothetical protein DCY88_10285 [Cyanobacteria bacterium UBA11372]|nr:hypothetical protein [Cyanobacteria bacterium UBA11372]
MYSGTLKGAAIQTKVYLIRVQTAMMLTFETKVRQKKCQVKQLIALLVTWRLFFSDGGGGT